MSLPVRVVHHDGGAGYCGHADISLAYHRSTHTDPGRESGRTEAEAGADLRLTAVTKRFGDFTAVDALETVREEVARRGIIFAMARVKQDLRDDLQSFVAHRTGEPDRLVDEAVRHLMPWHGSGPASLPASLSISERQLQRRCRATQ